MRSRSNGGVIGAYALPTQNGANGVFFIHDAAIFNTGANPIWPLASGYITSATGGTITTAVDNTNYKLHTFTANGTFTVATGSAQLEILIVAGGGAGGWCNGANGCAGGGGGGGIVVATTWVNPGTTFTVEVGSGGTGTFSTANGKPSKITSTAGHSYIANGGGTGGAGAGGLNDYTDGINGGSGGGAGVQVTNWLGVPGIGITTNNNLAYNGANAAFVTSYSDPYSMSGGGGGGASEAGHTILDSITSRQGAGGDGYLWPRTNYVYSAGGGAGKLARAGNAIRTYGGLQGSNGGTRSNATNYGGGGRCSTTLGIVAGYPSSNYGSGGGGTATNTTDTVTAGGSGAQGIVIFAYRYR